MLKTCPSADRLPLVERAYKAEEETPSRCTAAVNKCEKFEGPIKERAALTRSSRPDRRAEHTMACLIFPHSATRANQSAYIRSRRQRAATGRRCNQVARSLSGASRLDLQLSSSQATGTLICPRRVERVNTTAAGGKARRCSARAASTVPTHRGARRAQVLRQGDAHLGRAGRICTRIPELPTSGGRVASRPCEGSQPSVRGAGLLVGRVLKGFS